MQASAGRRRFLEFLLASPLVGRAQGQGDLITDPKQALNVMDFAPVAEKKLPAAHWGYLATGVEDDATLRANREGFNRFYLRPRRLIDIRSVDTSVEVFGQKWEAPIGLAPVGNMMAFHPEPELSVARAAKARGTMQVVSTYANSKLTDIAEAHGSPVWFQLYLQNQWRLTEMVIKRAEDAGCPVIAVTVDTQAGRRTETAERFKKLDKRDCSMCHGESRAAFFVRKPIFSGADFSGNLGGDQSMSWKKLEQLRKTVKGKLLLKGLETAEDAKLCVEAGMDGLIVSNHGGRAGETGRGTIEALPEVLEAVNGRIPVFIDGGFRRGSDVFKALALGAKAVFVGRPYIWGLAAFGQAGVDRVIELLRAELELVMRQNGATSIAGITQKHIGRRG